MKHCYCLVIAILLLSCSKESSDPKPEPLPMSVTTENAVELPDGKIKFSGTINNYLANKVGSCGFAIECEGTFRKVSIPSTSSSKYEIVVDGLPFIETISYSAFFEKIVDADHSVNVSDTQNRKELETGFPPISSITHTNKITDFSEVTVMGNGFGSSTFFYFGCKRSDNAPIEYFSFREMTMDANKFEGRVPIIGARGDSIPTFFTGRIQPAGLYVGNKSKTRMKKIEDLDYAYVFSLSNLTEPVHGTFEATIFYGRQSPLLDQIEVYFGDTKVKILNKKYVYGLSLNKPLSLDLVEQSLLTCEIPLGAVVGSTYKIKVVSPFGEEFISFRDLLTITY